MSEYKEALEAHEIIDKIKPFGLNSGPNGLLRRVESAQPLEIQGKHSSRDNYNVSERGTDAAYLTSRIARDNPDILEDMKAGKYRSADTP